MGSQLLFFRSPSAGRENSPESNMWRFCSPVLVEVGMVKPSLLVKLVSVTQVSGKILRTQHTEPPRPPLPPLRQTLDHYLRILEPAVEEDELRRTKALVEEFQKAGGIGERLQRGLEWRERNTENWFFKLDVFDRDGSRLTVDQLCGQLERICNWSQETNVAPVGILTTQRRDVWGKTYLNLIKDETNRTSVWTIESSIFTVCLDGAMAPGTYGKYLQMLHGGGSQWNSGNRWFDKSLQVIHHRCCPTLEPISLRMFSMGRLATINSKTTTSVAFVEAFDDPDVQNSRKLDLMKKAVEAHKRHMMMGSRGESVRPHLLMLKKQAVSEKMSMPEIFTDTSFTKVFDFKIVTSQNGCLPFMAPEKPDAYSVCHHIENDYIGFTVFYFDASKTCRENKAEKLTQTLEEAMMDMRTLLEPGL